MIITILRYPQLIQILFRTQFSFKYQPAFYLVDCKWGEWTDLGDCSQTCGDDAVKKLTRKITNKAKYGGSPCVGDTTKIINCDLEPCKGIN